MGKKKRLKAHVQRHMERRRRGNKKPRQKVVNDSKKKIEGNESENNQSSQVL